MTAANFSGRMLAAAKYELLLGLSILRFKPLRGFVTLLQATVTFPVGTLHALSKKL